VLLAAVESIYRDLEQRWADVVGQDRAERLRADLDALLLGPTTQRLPRSAALEKRTARPLSVQRSFASAMSRTLRERRSP
jgi:hypothetical protein